MESHHDKKTEKIEHQSKTEAVDKLISEKKSERATEGLKAVMESAEGVQTEVADVMAGVEAPREGVSEKKGESGERRDISGAGQQAQDDRKAQAAAAFAARRGLPREEIMIKKVRTAITAQIKMEMKKAIKLQKNLSTGSAQEYNTSIAKIRRLQETLKSLFNNTFEAVKGLYFKYFNAEGRRKSMEEL